MPKKGASLPYKAHFAFSNGISGLNPYEEIQDADRNAREVAGRGGVGSVLMVTGDGRRLRLVQYTENYLPELTVSDRLLGVERDKAYAAYYRELGTPVEVRKTGLPEPIKTKAPAPKPERKVTVTEVTEIPRATALDLARRRAAEQGDAMELSSLALDALLPLMGVKVDGRITPGHKFILTPAELAKLVRAALRAPQD